MRQPGWDEIFEARPVIIDGGLSTQLERRGHDISGTLWTARALLERPDAVEQAHHDFVLAGADVIITASYQVSRSGFLAAGLSAREADLALVTATEVARRAAVTPQTVVAASVGPFGATLHDGSEYRGRYGRSRDELASFHAERLAVLVDSGPDLLAIETIPDVDEAWAIADALTAWPGLPAWMSFSCVDDAHVCAGQPIEEAVRAAASIASVVAVGVNCTDPAHVDGLLARMAAVTDLPLIVYANAGGTWDPQTGDWRGAHAHVADLAPDWVAAGASAVGGCCGTDAHDIRRLAEQVR